MELPAPALYVFYIALSSILILLLGFAVTSRLKKVPGRSQSALELMTDGLKNTFLGALGPGGEKHLWLIFALFWYIIFSNLVELIPLVKATTGNPSNTIGLGLIVFFYVQAVGIRSKGLGPYLKHFMGPGIWWLVPIFILIEPLSEMVKPISLGMRLFGNIYAEDVMNDLAARAAHPAGWPFAIPFQFFIYFLQVFTGVIQAFIFSLLSAAYIGLMSETHDDHHDESTATAGAHA